MSRHLLDRPFDQERFDELKREAQTLINTLKVTKVTPGRVHKKGALLYKLRYGVEAIENHGEYYSEFKSSRFYYTLDTLEDMIGRVNKFLAGAQPYSITGGAV